MKKILITGLNGFVGSNLGEYLKQKGYEVYGLSRYRINTNNCFSYEELDECFKHDYLAVIHTAGKAHDTKHTSSDLEYIEINYELTVKIYGYYLKSNSQKFIYFSSVKAAADKVDSVLWENVVSKPGTIYGKSKLRAESYLLSTNTQKDLFILRPCMIHGPGNKGNLNLLYDIFSKGIPFPLGAFSNARSLLSIDNLCFVINELISQKNIPSGIYNVSDSGTISTKDIIKILASTLPKEIMIVNIPKSIVRIIAKVGNYLPIPLNEERLEKLTENYVVSNQKLINAINKQFPISIEEGLQKTFCNFNPPN